MTNGDKIRKMTNEELTAVLQCPYEGVSDTCIFPCAQERPSCTDCISFTGKRGGGMSDLINRKDVLDALSVLNDNQYGNVHFRNGIANAMSIVEDAPAVEKTAEWTSVKDRLPETIPCNAGTAYSEAVCVLTEDKIVCTAVWNGEYWIGDFDYWEADWRTVTHWKPVIPLPEPPKGDTE